MRRIRAAIGMGVTWAVVWGGAGAIAQLAFVLVTGSRADAPLPLVGGVLGFGAGFVFSAVLSIVARNRRFDQLSIPRFAAWGAGGGFAMSILFVLAVSAANVAFMSSVALLAPIFAIAGAASAAASLAIARRADLILEPGK